MKQPSEKLLTIINEQDSCFTSIVEKAPRRFEAYEETWLEPETIASEHSGINSELRKGCPMRHENGNCTPVGGFCTAVNDPICEGLHSAYDAGWHAAALHAQQEAGRYRFYYCESEDSYLLGARVDNFYYAHWDGKSFVWDMSRYLPWGEHIVSPATVWKEHTFPSEPKEIGPEEWFRGFLTKLNTESDENEPLTLDELREIAESEAGSHIWVKDLVDGFVTAAIDVFQGKAVAVWTCTNDYYMEEDYGKTWLVYRHKPEEK